MKWRTDTPTANVIVALISDGGGYDVLYKRDDGEYVNRYDELPYSIIEKWADLEEDETVTDCNELETEIERYIAPIHADEIKYEPFTSIEECARHFAKWGAEHLIAPNKMIGDHIADDNKMISSDSKISNSLDEAAEEEYPDYSDSIAAKAAVNAARDAFKAGAEWHARQGQIL